MINYSSNLHFEYNIFGRDTPNMTSIYLKVTILAVMTTSMINGFAPRSTTLGINKAFIKSQSSEQKINVPPLLMSEDNEWQAPKSAMIGGAGVNNAGEPPFEIRGFSLGNVVILGGILITALSFYEYLTSDGGEGLNVSGLGFVYGIPVFLAGAALKYAEIEPVPCISTGVSESMFESKATEIIKKIKQDVTRHRYGDEAHLDTTVKRLGLVVPGKAYPQLLELRESVAENGELEFMMVWQSEDTPFKLWNDPKRVQKYATFFGPGVSAECIKVNAEKKIVGIKLTTGDPVVEEKAIAA